MAGRWRAHAVCGVQRAKSNIANETFADMAHFPWLPRLLAWLRAPGRLSEPALPTTHAEWAALFDSVVAALPLDELGRLILYQLRHGGASHEALLKTLPLDEIKRKLMGSSPK